MFVLPACLKPTLLTLQECSVAPERRTHLVFHAIFILNPSVSSQGLKVTLLLLFCCCCFVVAVVAAASVLPATLRV